MVGRSKVVPGVAMEQVSSASSSAHDPRRRCVRATGSRSSTRHRETETEGREGSEKVGVMWWCHCLASVGGVVFEGSSWRVPAWMEARAADCSASMRSLRRLGVGAEEAVEAWLGPPPCRKSVTADCTRAQGQGRQG